MPTNQIMSKIETLLYWEKITVGNAKIHLKWACCKIDFFAKQSNILAAETTIGPCLLPLFLTFRQGESCKITFCNAPTIYLLFLTIANRTRFVPCLSHSYSPIASNADDRFLLIQNVYATSNRAKSSFEMQKECRTILSKVDLPSFLSVAPANVARWSR